MSNAELDALVARVREEVTDEAALDSYFYPCYENHEGGITYGDLRALCDEVERLTRERDAWQEREAKVCPEDFGFEEVIASLRTKVTRLTAEVERLTREREEAHRLLGKLEWSGSKQCQYSGFARACPSCGGVDPTDECNASSFIASALGHREGCPLHAARTTGGRDA